MFRRYLLTVGPDLAKCCRFGLFVKSGQFLAELFSVGQNFEPTLAKKKFAFGVILTVVNGQILKLKPQVSLTVPNCNQFAQVSLTILYFLYAIAKAKKLFCKSIAQNLKQDLNSFGNSS